MSIDVAQRDAGSEAQSSPLSQRWAARAEAVSRVYGSGETRVRALDAVDVGFGRGELTAVMGPSGSGKSTLMQCVSGLDRVTDGRVWLGEQDLSALGERALTELRRDRVGFVFQAFNLLPTLTARENITLPADLARRSLDADWVEYVIDTLGLRARLAHRPGELSGGQQQRVACARALVGRPELVLADEPTGNLDSRSAAEVLDLLRRSVDELGQTVALVTHDAAAAAYADRVVFLLDGRVVTELRAPSATEVLETMAGLERTAVGAPPGAGGAGDRPERPEPGPGRRAPGAVPEVVEVARTARRLREQLNAFITEAESLTARVEHHGTEHHGDAGASGTSTGSTHPGNGHATGRWAAEQ